MTQNVRDRQRQLALRLNRELDGSYVVVPAPDHPLVVRSVDVLVGGRSGLTAFMMPSSEELRRPSLLRSRIILNRIALPPETQFVYIATTDQDRPPLSSGFTELLDSADRSLTRNAVSIISDSEKAKPSPSAEKWRQLAHTRFANTYRVAKIANAPRFKAVDDNRQQGIRRRRVDTTSSVQSVIAGRSVSNRLLVGLGVRGTERWFRPDDNQITSTGEPAGVVFAPSFVHMRHDPDKALRAAAFSGWVLAPRDSTQSPEELTDLAFRFARLR